MKLRRLQEKDAPYMFEWMKDCRVNRYFRFVPDDITMKSVIEFISYSNEKSNSYNFAITDDEDIYLGTVSLKNVDMVSKNGEYAIALRICAQGKGAGKFATQSILSFAFNELQLERVYLNVLSDNEHAIAFYKKCGFIYEGEFYHHLYLRGEWKNLQWFRMMKKEYQQ
jgi:diamine N-acetyltransferase